MAQTVFTAKGNDVAVVDQAIQQKLNSNAKNVVVAMSSTSCFDFKTKEVIYTTTVVYMVDNSIVL